MSPVTLLQQRHNVVYFSGVFMLSNFTLPDSNYFPPVVSQFLCYKTISLFVLGYFLFPILIIMTRFAFSTAMTMPITSINEYDDFVFWKNKIWLSCKLAVSTPSRDFIRFEYAD